MLLLCNVVVVNVKIEFDLVVEIVDVMVLKIKKFITKLFLPTSLVEHVVANEKDVPTLHCKFISSKFVVWLVKFAQK